METLDSYEIERRRFDHGLELVCQGSLCTFEQSVQDYVFDVFYRILVLRSFRCTVELFVCLVHLDNQSPQIREQIVVAVAVHGLLKQLFQCTIFYEDFPSVQESRECFRFITVFTQQAQKCKVFF